MYGTSIPQDSRISEPSKDSSQLTSFSRLGPPTGRVYGLHFQRTPSDSIAKQNVLPLCVGELQVRER